MKRQEFLARYGAVYEHSQWVAERAYDGGIGNGADVAPVFRRIVDRAGHDAQLTLLRAHPDLAGRLGTALTAHSTAEQEGAGLNACSPEEFAEFSSLNETYKERFGFPFIIAVKGLDRPTILKRFRQRVEGTPEEEFGTALNEVHKIAGLRLAALAAGPEVPREPVDLGEVLRLAERALTNAGADAANAAAVAQNIAAAERDGSESHGLFRLPGYCNGLRKGEVNGKAVPSVVSAAGASVVVDGDGGAAPVAYAVALPALAQKAEELGVAALALRNTVHFAAMWPEVEWLCERGLAAFAATANYPYLAPFGGTRPFFGTNPIAFAYPTGSTPVVFDFATSAMARGDIMLAGRDGRQVGEAVGIDRYGEPTSDPAAILDGAQLPFGAHKGSAIALMVELLAAGLIGDVFSDENAIRADPTGLPLGGVFILAISPRALGGAEAIARSAAWVERLAAEPGVRVPGQRRHKKRAAGGPAMVERALLEKVRALADEA